jgi:hypothetical protein
MKPAIASQPSELVWLPTLETEQLVGGVGIHGHALAVGATQVVEHSRLWH